MTTNWPSVTNRRLSELPKTDGYGSLPVVRNVAHQGLHHLGVSLHREDGRPLFDAVIRTGHDGNHLPAVGQAQPNGKGAVVPQLHRLALERHVRVAVDRAIHNDLGVDGEFKLIRVASGRPAAIAGFHWRPKWTP